MKAYSLHVYTILLFCIGIIYGLHGVPYVSRLVKNKDKAIQVGRGGSELLMFLNQVRIGPAYKCMCGISFHSGDRIVGGEVTQANEYPWQVGLCEGYNRPYCGGSLINDLYVLTAGHCVYGRQSDEVMVLLGEHDNDNDEDKAFRVPVEKLIPYPKYNDETLVYDIGLVRMEERVPFSDITLPPCFPPPDVEYAGELGLVTGWGRTMEDGEASPVLRKVEVPIIPWDECYARYQGEVEILDNMLCAAWDAGEKDACEGDSGGPLIWRNDGRWFLIGIVSWGIGCARPDSPAAYTRVDKFYRWIDRHTADASTCTD